MNTWHGMLELILEPLLGLVAALLSSISMALLFVLQSLTLIIASLVELLASLLQLNLEVLCHYVYGEEKKPRSKIKFDRLRNCISERRRKRKTKSRRKWKNLITRCSWGRLIVTFPYSVSRKGILWGPTSRFVDHWWGLLLFCWSFRIYYLFRQQSSELELWDPRRCGRLLDHDSYRVGVKHHQPSRTFSMASVLVPHRRMGLVQER